MSGPLYIPLHLRLSPTTPERARLVKAVLEKLLSGPMVRSLLNANGVTYEAIVVSEPVDQEGRAV